MDEELILVEMELRELQMKQDPMGGGQVLILEERDGSREFAIWIGPQEALALDLVLHGQTTPRPLTHDLLFNVIDGLGGELQHSDDTPGSVQDRGPRARLPWHKAWHK